jgi:hypothetical protein
MKLFLDIEIKSPVEKISYDSRIFLIGSCFTEHIGGRLTDFKFPVLQNPHGILFDPVSVCKSLISYIENKKYTPKELFFLNDLWQSWHHHSVFSGVDQDAVLENINNSQQNAHEFLATANWMVITLGSSFSYQLIEEKLPVANCHRAPAQWFKKHLLSTDETISALDNCLYQLFRFNPNLKVIFTVSPVRHIRDGVVENNRSKARLIESVHHLVDKFDRLYYFPAYEIVIDVLRDYRFYDIDLVHPNYAATEFVFEKFRESYISAGALEIMDEVKKFVTAARHKPFQPETRAHKTFLQTQLEKIKQFQKKNVQVDLSGEIRYFSNALDKS